MKTIIEDFMRKSGVISEAKDRFKTTACNSFCPRQFGYQDNYDDDVGMCDVNCTDCWNREIDNDEIKSQGGGKTMKQTLYKRLVEHLMETAGNVNFYAGMHDIERNKVNYGCATTYAAVLEELGHSADLMAYGYLDSTGQEFLRISEIELDGRKIKIPVDSDEKKGEADEEERG